MLGGDETALAIARIAVGVVGGTAVDARAPRLLVPAHDTIVGNVAPEQAARIAEIDRPLCPTETGREPFDAREWEAIFPKARIEHLDSRVGIARVRLPCRQGGVGECHGRRRAGARQHVASRIGHGVTSLPAAQRTAKGELYGRPNGTPAVTVCTGLR